MDNIIVHSGYVELSGKDYNTGEDCTYTIDKKTVFSSDCDMQFFENYKSGETVLEWVNENFMLMMNEDYATQPLIRDSFIRLLYFFAII